MSVEWCFHILANPGALTASRLTLLVQEAEAIGLEPSGLESKEVVVMTGDGSGSLIFSTADAALEWLGVEDGLLEFVSRGSSLRLTMSLHRCNGILPNEMLSIPDEPYFDVLTLSISRTDLRSSERQRLWEAVEYLTGRGARIFEARFVYGIDDDSLEAQIPFLCIQKRVAADRLPPALGWLIAGPRCSPLASQIAALAEALDRPISSVDDLTALKLTDLPWEATPDCVSAAATTWRTISNEAGCGS